ncbi:hypothetical protein DFP72DRAFT_918576 [Ephemerocybe angulata]|uniref:RING-type domain-containing protein n=1 Tax=Ephemerocybe angulata TaxID=980116 RepID=A0A8H6HLF7_9AGAR|nr:hypothetical protein DFP72DRAFT_918576 [Tulosesus angulatus]
MDGYHDFSDHLRQNPAAADAPTNARPASNHAEPALEPQAPSMVRSSGSSPTADDVEMADHSSPARNVQADNPESSNNSREVEMQFQDPPLPEIDPAAPSRSNNRRARVDDDDDDERDRRHPSQRITSPSSSQSTRPPTPRLPRTSTTNTPSRSATTSSAPRHPPTPADPTAVPTQPAAAPHPFLSGGIAITFDFGPDPFAAPGGGAPAAGENPQGAEQTGALGGETFTNMFSNPAFLHDFLGLEPDVDDPERAERLINGLEEVPVGLIRRLEKVGGIGTTGTELNGGDSGCAVCWEPLLEPDDSDDTSKSKEKGKDNDGEKKSQPKIVSLPCGHVFHADCLRPWFSRPKQTTCPTCRFNIDPENLTFVPFRQRRADNQASAAASTTETAASQAAGTTRPAASSSTSSFGELPRGRPASAPVSTPPPRRAGSEPPLNRVPPPTAPQPTLMQTFALPGGHVVIVTQPNPANAQGQPTAGEFRSQHICRLLRPVIVPRPAEGAPERQSQDDAPPQSTSPAAGASGQGASPSIASRPVFGPPPPPPTTASGSVPPGMIALDIHFTPIPFAPGTASAGAIPRPPQQTQAQTSTPQPTAPVPPQTPPLHVPGGFAGLNFGRAPGVPGVSATDMLRSIFNNMSQTRASQPPSQSSATDNSTPSGSAPAATPSAPSNTSVDATSPPNAAAEEASRNTNNDAAFFRFLASAMSNPATLLRLLLSAGLMGAAGIGLGNGPGPTARARDTPKKEWSPPAAPGPSLRQRVERREREAGLRCSAISCGIGPTDDEPYISDADASAKQVSIHAVGDESRKVCNHTFHPPCLVSSERVALALRGVDAPVVGNDVEVSCPVCRTPGCISKADWDEGVRALQ